MATVIFKWTPSFSSYMMKTFLVELSYCTPRSITPEYLAETGFPENILEAILSVTRREGESYDKDTARLNKYMRAYRYLSSLS